MPPLFNLLLKTKNINNIKVIRKNPITATKSLDTDT